MNKKEERRKTTEEDKDLMGIKMKKGFTLVDFMVIVAITGLLAAIVVRSAVNAKRKSEMKGMTPEQIDQKNTEIKKICEIDGYNVWSINSRETTGDQLNHYVAIPVPKTNSVTLERP